MYLLSSWTPSSIRIWKHHQWSKNIYHNNYILLITRYKLVCWFWPSVKTVPHIFLLLRLSAISCFLPRVLCMIKASCWFCQCDSTSCWDFRHKPQSHQQSRQEAFFGTVSAGSKRSQTASAEAKYDGTVLARSQNWQTGLFPVLT